DRDMAENADEALHPDHAAHHRELAAMRPILFLRNPCALRDLAHEPAPARVRALLRSSAGRSRGRPRTQSAGITCTLIIAVTSQCAATSTPPKVGPTMEPMRPMPIDQPTPVERIAVG